MPEIDDSVTPVPPESPPPSAQGIDQASGGRLAQNALSSYLPLLAGSLTGLFVTPILIHKLGSSQYGTYIFLLSVVGWIGMTEMGVQTALAKRVAHYLSAGDTQALQTCINTALGVYAAVAAVAAALNITVAVLSGYIPALKHSPHAIIITCILLLGINQTVLFANATFNSMLFGCGRADISARINAVLNPLAVLSMAAVVLAGYGIRAVCAVTVVTSTINGIIAYQAARRQLPSIRLDWRNASPRVARELVKFGSRNALLSLAGSIGYGSDTLVIGMLLPVSNVAHYAIASKLSILVSSVITRPMDILMPAFSHLHARHEEERKFRLYATAVSVTMAIGFPFVICMAVFGRRIISMWVGPGQDVSALLATTLLLVTLVGLPGRAAAQLMIGTELNLLLTRIYLAAAPLNLILSVFLTRRIGPIGVALGSLAMIAVVDFTILPIHACKLMGVPYRRLLAAILPPLALPVLASLTVAILLSRIGPAGFRFWPLAMLVIVLIVGWATWFRFGIGPSSRKSYIAAIKARGRGAAVNFAQ